MKLGEFSDSKARSEAMAFLQTSISTLSMILGVDEESFNVDLQNPHEFDSPFYIPYNVLKSEITAINKLKQKNL